MIRLAHGGRSLLNLPGHHTTAAIVAEVDDTSNWPAKGRESEYDGYQVQPSVVCKITDCDNAVNIEFDLTTAAQLENSLHKVDIMVEALTNLREGLIVEHHRLHDRMERVPEARLYGLKRAKGKRSDIQPSTPTQEG